MKKKKEKIENLALDVAEILAQGITPEMDQKTDQEIGVIGESIAQNMNPKIDIDQEKGKDAQEPLALIIKGVKINPAMEGGEGTAKRP